MKTMLFKQGDLLTFLPKFGYLSLACFVSCLVGTSSQAQTTDVGQNTSSDQEKSGGEKWPIVPTLDYRSLRGDGQAIHRVVPFDTTYSAWPERFAAFRDLVKLENLNIPKGVHGRMIYSRGFWDEISSPARIMHFLILNRWSEQRAAQRLYQFSYPEHVLWIAGRPEFSPNGKQLFILDGAVPPDKFDNFGVFTWDFSLGRISGSKEPLLFDLNAKVDPLIRNKPATYYQRALWSPGSRFLSYLRGGNAYGDYDQWTKPYELYVADTRSHQERRIATDVGHHWSWTGKGTLLFSYLKPENAYAVAGRTARPSVYEADIKGTKPVKLFDGGYFAQESPDGQWIAFCDWPGSLTDNPKASKELVEQKERGLFLYHRASKRRVFVGKLSLGVGQPPLLQWMPDGQSLFVLESRQDGEKLLGTLWKMEIEQQTLNKFSEVSTTAGTGYANVSKPGYFSIISTSPKSLYLYLETVTVTDTDPRSRRANTERALIAVNTQKGEQTVMARLSHRIGGETVWDWHDDSGINPAFASAEKVEGKLPLIEAPVSKAISKATSKPVPKTTAARKPIRKTAPAKTPVKKR